MKARTGRNVTGRTGKAEHSGKTEKDRQNRNRISTLGLRKKREFELFFFRARRFRFFSRFFPSRFRALFFASRSRAQKRERAKKAPARTSAIYACNSCRLVKQWTFIHSVFFCSPSCQRFFPVNLSKRYRLVHTEKLQGDDSMYKCSRLPWVCPARAGTGHK